MTQLVSTESDRPSAVARSKRNPSTPISRCQYLRLSRTNRWTTGLSASSVLPQPVSLTYSPGEPASVR
jgi:hypothetical protein